MQTNCRNCLAQEVCDITGGVCQKMDALFAQRKSVTNGRTTMTTPKNAATPKNVADIKSKNETTVPAQATAPVESSNHDKVLDNDRKTLFSGTPKDVRDWLNEQTDKVYVVRTAGGELVHSIEYVELEGKKLSLVQRAKEKALKLKTNKRSQLMLATAVVFAGVAFQKSRKLKAVAAEETLDDVEVTVENPDDTTDSI